jgi:CYTH domain-containing protein
MTGDSDTITLCTSSRRFDRSVYFALADWVPTSLVFGENVNMEPQHKYARIERERRFLLEQFPSNANVVRIRRLSDRYIEGTALRLREQSEDGGLTMFKLTHKVPARASGAQQGFITSMYLTQDEFCVLAQLSAKKLSKTRYSVPPFGIDVFEGTLQGLVLAEAEFDSAAAADALTLPSFMLREVSADNRFTGGQLVRASRQDIQTWLSEYGITLRSP